MTELDIQAQKDYAVKEARSEGLAEGEARGEAKGKLETAKNLLKEGSPVDFICRVTGLTREEVSALR